MDTVREIFGQDFEMYAPDSSAIELFGYDDASGTLVVKFTKNPLFYLYFGVEATIADGLRLAESVGKFFNEAIKGGYNYKAFS